MRSYQTFRALWLIVFTLSISHIANTQPEILWSQTYSDEGRGTQCWDHIQTVGGGFALAGITSSPQDGETDFFFVVTGGNGREIWSHSYGGQRGDRCAAVVQTDDGNFVLAGNTRSFGQGEEDWYVIMTDDEGREIWSRTYGGDHYDACFSVIQLDDGDLSLFGFTWSFGAGEKDYYLIKIDNEGETLWAHTYGGEQFDYGRKHIVTSDGGFAMVGYTISIGHGGKDMGLCKVDGEGELSWWQAYGGEYNDDCFAVIQTSDGGYALAGYTQAFEDAVTDCWLVKTDADGEMQWSRTYGGEEEECWQDLCQLDDGGFLLVGYTFSYGNGDSDIYLVRTDPNGEELWTQTLGDEFAEDCYSLIRTDLGYSLAGYTNPVNERRTDFWLVQTGDDPVIQFSIPMRRGWNMISSPVMPPVNDIEVIWADIIDRGSLLLVKDQYGRFYAPARGINQLETWDVRYGYQAKLTEADNLVILNQPVPENTPIPLTEDWSIVSYFPENRIAAREALANIEDELLIAKDGRGRFYLPAYGYSNMGLLRRGRGYQVKVSEDLELVWNMPDGGNLIDRQLAIDNCQLSIANGKDNQCVHFDHVEPTGLNMSILLTVDNCQFSIRNKFEVAAFTLNKKCIGSMAISGKGPWGMPVWGDDPTTDIADGAIEGEQLSFRIWNGMREKNITPNWIEGNDYYITDGFGVVELIMDNILPETFRLEDPYPNPFNNQTRLSFSLASTTEAKLVVYDVSGCMIDIFFEGLHNAGSYSILWNAKNMSNGIYIIQLKVDGCIQSTKALLLK